jgi:hypothetical protein
MHGGLNALQPPSYIPRVSPLKHVLNPGVNRVGGSVHRLHLRHSIRPPNLIHMQGGQHDAFGITQSERLAWADGLGEILSNIQYNRNRPQEAVLEALVATHTLIVGTGHKSPKWRKAPVQK